MIAKNKMTMKRLAGPLSFALAEFSLSVSFSFSLSPSQVTLGDGHVALEHAWPLMEFMPLSAPHSKLALQASHRLNRRAVSCADDVRVRTLLVLHPYKSTELLRNSGN